MYFGEFLLSKKVINEEQLLDALIYQVEHLPSFLRILRQEKLLAPDEILRMIQMQFENSTDLIAVLKKEKKIDESILQNLYKKQVLERKMLGTVLVELKFLEQTVLESMLHEFLRDKENLIKTAAPKSAGKISAPPDICDAALESLRELGLSDEALVIQPQKISADIEISEAALESMRELGITDNSVQNTPVQESNIFIEEYLNVFNEKLNAKITKLISILDQSTKDESEISNYYNSLYRDIVLLKGSSLLIELVEPVKLLEKWADIVEAKLMLNDNEKLKNWTSLAVPLLTETFSYLWDIREIISKEKNTISIQNKKALSDRFQKIIHELNALN